MKSYVYSSVVDSFEEKDLATMNEIMFARKPTYIRVYDQAQCRIRSGPGGEGSLKPPSPFLDIL